MCDQPTKLKDTSPPEPVDPALIFTAGMGVEWDDGKDAINRKKHGYALASIIDWLERTWMPLGIPPPTVWLEQPGRSDGEPRYRMLSVDWEGHVVDFVFTVRENNGGTALRIISFRRADDKQVEAFNAHWSADEVKQWLNDTYGA